MSFDDAGEGAWVEFTAMPRTKAPVADALPATFGKAVLAAVIPRYWKDMQAMHLETRIAYSTLHGWKTGLQEPRLDQVKRVAEVLNERPGVSMTALELLGGMPAPPPSGHRVCDHAEYPAALAEFEERFARAAPRAALTYAVQTSGAQLPEHIDGAFLLDLAQFWLRHMSDAELAAGELAEIHGEMAAADEKHAALKRKKTTRG